MAGGIDDLTLVRTRRERLVFEIEPIAQYTPTAIITGLEDGKLQIQGGQIVLPSLPPLKGWTVVARIITMKDESDNPLWTVQV
jgi:hypothetical protein